MEYLSFDQKCRLISAKLRGASVVWICSRYNVSRPTFYLHWRNFQKDGWVGLKPKSHRPKTVHKTPQDTLKYILKCRRDYGWGPNKIEAHLRIDQPRGIQPVSHQTIYKIICEAGLNEPIDEPRKTWGKRRFQRHNPNELWQADWKLTRDDEWMITYLDDYSRFIPGSQVFHNANTENTLKVLKQALEAYGRPQQILTDQGVQFYTYHEEGKSQFTRFLEKNKIQHIVASKRRPTTTGKVERFHGSFEREAHLFPTHQDYIQHWNWRRPHQGIDYNKPAELYFKDQSVKHQGC